MTDQVDELAGKADEEPIELGAQKLLAGASALAGSVVTAAFLWIMVLGWPAGQTPEGWLAAIPPELLGAIGSAWFGFLTLRGVRGLLSQPRLEITEEGIVNRSFLLSSGMIEWSEIEGTKSIGFHGVELVLRDPRAYRSRQSLPRRIIGRLLSLVRAGPTTVFSLDMSGRRRAIVDLIEERLAARELAAVKEPAQLATPSTGTPAEELES